MFFNYLSNNPYFIGSWKEAVVGKGETQVISNVAFFRQIFFFFLSKPEKKKFNPFPHIYSFQHNEEKSFRKTWW